MSYQKQEWVDRSSIFTKDRADHIETGVYEAHEAVGALNTELGNLTQDLDLTNLQVQELETSKADKTIVDQSIADLGSQLAQIALNVTSLGAIGDGLADDSSYFIDNNLLLDKNKLFALDKYTILDTYNNKTILGEGNVKWKNWVDLASNQGRLTGIIPASKFTDPIFCSMQLPSEGIAPVMQARVNASLIADPFNGYCDVCGIGAIYQNTEYDLPENFTLCLGKMKVFAITNKNKQWHILSEDTFPSSRLYDVSWNGTSKDFPYTEYDDHIEYHLSKSDFQDYCLHFFGKRVSGVDADNLIAIAVAFDCWIKEDVYAGYFVSTIGADYRDNEGNTGVTIAQAFTGRNQRLNGTRRTHWGHNIPDNLYNEIMDTDSVIPLWNQPILKNKEIVNERKSENILYTTSFNNGYELFRGSKLTYTDVEGKTVRINHNVDLRIPITSLYSTGSYILLYSVQSLKRIMSLCKIRISAIKDSVFYHGEFLVYVNSATDYTNAYAKIETTNSNFPVTGKMLEVELNNGFNIYMYSKGLGYTTFSVVIEEIGYFAADSKINIPNILLAPYCGFFTPSEEQLQLWNTATLSGISLVSI